VSEPFKSPPRLLLGAGPSQVPESVLAALAQPTIGHFDPAFLELTELISDRLRGLFRTDNKVTLALSTTGSGGPSAMAANFVEAGDRVVVGVAGVFGERLAQAIERVGAEVMRVEGEWGRSIPAERLTGALEGASALALVHGETSTGAVQSLEGLADACRDRDALLLLDCVTSLGGQGVLIDEWGVDAAYSGTQKCLNCPPGLSPFTAGERAIERIGARKSPPSSWYLDLEMIAGYWDPDRRSYHHTAPINMLYGLAEALRLIEDEGLEPRWARHRAAHESLRAGLAAWGLEVVAPPEEALWPLTAVLVPDGVDESAVRGRLLEEDGIEISGGLGELAGRAWRIGLMGQNATLETVELLLEALAGALSAAGRAASPDAAIAEARRATSAASAAPRPA
jgi:alanine-glyoxylate transaminase/serine-glyoxylate transaminase/serine-pyruvate transaminase